MKTKGHPFPERSKSEKMKCAQDQSGFEVGQETSQDGKSKTGYMFKICPTPNKTQVFGDKECCR